MSRELAILTQIAKAVADEEIDLSDARLHGQALGFEATMVDAAIIGLLLGLLEIYRAERHIPRA